MTRRSLTGFLVLAALLTSLLYLWKPWDLSDPSLKLGLDLQGGLRVVLQSEVPNPDREDLDTARNIIENRVNEFGVSEPLIQTSGTDRIIVELPGLTAEDQNRALGLIGQQAILEFRLVRQSASTQPHNTLTLDDLEEVAFTGEVIRTARADFDRVGGTALGPAVFFDIRREFVNDFGNFTGSNIGRRMAIVLDGRIQTAPVLQARISDSGQITGIESLEEASDIALVLRSGSLPINLEVEEIRAIGPTLGQDSIAAGTRAAIVGGLLVIAAIVLYYGPLFGSVLMLGLVLAMIFIFGALAGLGAALTLPGLAGLVLTIGAAVDGNVISFERIKEELRSGKSLRLAMRGGFGNSLSAIIDANVTTLLAAASLYQYTSGPVRGFAITLAIGIISAVFVNTVVVPFLLDVLTIRIKRPLIPKGFYARGMRFISKAPLVMSISGLLAATAIALVLFLGLELSTDFTGGTNILLGVPEGTSVASVRTTIDELGFESLQGDQANIVEVQDNTIEGDLISVRVGIGASSEISDQFPGALSGALGADLLSADFVGPAVGSDLRQGAILAVLAALALIMLYVTWRFWPNWIVAIAAITAACHDVAIVLGVLNIIDAEFGIPVLAALLFVVGYSLNDSIIIADRIRENLRRVRDKSYAEIVDLSVNQTLSRTLVTSGTTMLPVLALLFLGGSVLRDFSITLLIGIAVGTYSSIFILSPMVVWFKKQQRSFRTTRRAV
ncbi:MAG: protein translocase subunit SecD [Trueperaceae bacterium]|nr:MAG: protein translocase subunit SecD [Trueperaceae bacterium]